MVVSKQVKQELHKISYRVWAESGSCTNRDYPHTGPKTASDFAIQKGSDGEDLTHSLW